MRQKCTISVEALEARRLLSAAAGPVVAAHLGGDGLSASYFNNTDLTGPEALARVDASIDFHWRRNAPNGALSPDAFSVRWTGEIAAPTTGTYRFKLRHDDGARLWVDGELLVDHWSGSHASRAATAAVSFTAGEPKPIQLQYQELAGPSRVQLKWAAPGGSLRVIPTDSLFSTATVTPGSTSSLPPASTTPPEAPPAILPTPIEVPSQSAPVPSVPAAAFVATYVVDPAGQIRTIQAAVDLAQPGDVIFIRPGVYHETIQITQSGTAERPITIAGTSIDETIIDGAGFSSVLTGGTNITVCDLTIRHCANGLQNYQAAVRTGVGWHVEDVVVEGVDGTGLCVFGSNVTLLRVTAQDNGQAGIGGDGCSDVLVKDCITRRNNGGALNPVWKDQTTVGGSNAAIRSGGQYFVNPDWEAGGGKWWMTARVTIDGLEASNNVGPGLWFDNNSTDVVIRNCTIRDNRSLPDKPWQGTGIRIELQSSGPIVIEGNTLAGNAGGNLSIEQARHVTVRNNAFISGNLRLRDYYRGADFTIQNVIITANTFRDSAIETWEGTWDASSAAVKRLTIEQNAWEPSSEPKIFWGGRSLLSLDDLHAIGVELLTS